MALRRRELWPRDANQLFSVAVDLTRAYERYQIKPQRDSKLVENLVVQIETTLNQAVESGWQVDTSNLVYETFKENPKIARFFSDRDTYE